MVHHASATVYKVGPTEPYPNLFSVASLVAPGDVVQVDGNATYEGGVVFSNNGAAGNPITIQGIAINGLRPVLAQTTGYSGTGGPVVEFAGSHYVMEGFDITQGGDPNAGSAFYSSGDDITLIDSAVHDCTVTGITSSAGAGSLTLEYVEVFNCGSGNSGNQIYAQSNLTAYPSACFEMEFCYVHDGAGGDNVKSRVPRTEIYYNWIEGAWLHELDLDGANPAAQAPGSLSGVQGVADVVGNVLLKDPGSYGFVANIGDSIGWTNGLYRFVNNTAVLSASSAVAKPVVLNLTDLVRSIEVYNNLFYGEAGGPISVLSTANLFLGWPCTIVGSNNWVPQGSTLVPSTWTNTVTGPDPQVANASTYNFTPLAGGSLAGAGAGSTPDPPGLTFPSPLAVPLYLPPSQESYVVNQALSRTVNVPIDIGAFAVPPAPYPDYQLPVAVNDNAQLVNHLPATIPVLANDTDSYGAPLSVRSVGPATSGTAAISGTNVVYTPSTTFSGSDSFTYSITDGYGVAAATVYVTYPGPTLYQVGPTEPYPDLGTVAPLLMPGDVVQVDGNATYPGGVSFRNSGTPANKIIIQGLRINGKRPAIYGTAGFTAVGTFVIRCLGSHYVFEGFDLTTGTNPNAWRGFYNVADDVTLADSVVHDCPCNGVDSSDAGGSLSLQYDEIYNCGSGLLEHQIYAGSSNLLYPNAVLDIEFCYIHNGTGGNNIKSRVARTQLYYNWIEGAYYHELDLDGADPGDQAPGTASLVQQVGDIVGNVIVKDSNTHGLVANVGGDGTGWSNGRYRFINNTIILPTTPIDSEMIFQLKNAVQSIDIYNNLIYRFGGGPVNLLDEVDWYSESLATVIGSNNWLPPASKLVPASLTNTVTGSLLDVVNAAGFNFTPLAGGNLAGAGATSTPDPPPYPFPSPLPAPLYLPPVQTAYALGQALPRPVNNPIDIGAFAVPVEPTPGGYSLPVALNDSIGISTPAPVYIPISSLGSDSNGQPVTLLNLGAASGGTVSVSGSDIVYRPASNFAGLDSFTYTIDDGNGMATGVINISTVPPDTGNPGAPVTTAVVLTQDPVPNLPGVQFKAFSYPALNSQGHTAFVATLTGSGVTQSTNTAVWADEGTVPKMCVARAGTAAPGANGAKFSTFCDPVYNNNDLVAFAATLSGAGIARTNSVGIWSDYPNGFLSMVAQEGQQAPGCPGGAVFSTFSELALPDQGGVVFLANLGNYPVGSSVNSHTSPISSANDQGIFAVNTSGTLQLVVQLGTFHPVTGKLITALSVLPVLPYDAGQTRSFNQSTGDIVYRATFKDGTSGIFLVTFP
jgi:hypothetical protein